MKSLRQIHEMHQEEQESRRQLLPNSKQLENAEEELRKLRAGEATEVKILVDAKALSLLKREYTDMVFFLAEKWRYDGTPHNYDVQLRSGKR